MRAPATSPIPAPVSAPQLARGNEATDASPFAAMMDAASAQDVANDKAEANAVKANAAKTKAAKASDVAAREDARLQDNTQQESDQQDIKDAATLADAAQPVAVPPPVLPMILTAQQSDTAQDSDLSDPAELQPQAQSALALAAPANSNTPPQAPGPDDAMAAEDAPPATPAPKPGKHANASASASAKAAANTVQDADEQRLDGAQTLLPVSDTLDAPTLVSALQTLQQNGQQNGQQALDQDARQAADAINAAPAATAPDPVGPASNDIAGKDLAARDPDAQDAAALARAQAGQKTDTVASADSEAKGKSGDIASASPDQLAGAAPEAPKPQQPAANTNFVQHLAAAMDGDGPAQPATPGITQHVSVSSAPQAAPDLPALAISIRARSQSGAKQFDIRLDPPELGRVEVRLSIDHAGKASAHLSADQPQTLDLLQKDSAVLARALRDAGLNVSQDGLNFSLRQGSQDGSAQDMGGRDGTRGQRGTQLTASKSIEATATSAAYRAPADGRLDIRV